MAITVQVQSVIYHNDHESLMRAYESLANAVRVNRERSAEELRLIVQGRDLPLIKVVLMQ